MSSVQDPIRDGLRRGWKVLGGPYGEAPSRIACDVAMVGSGAGAGITAELLARAGLKVVIVEEGPLDYPLTAFLMDGARRALLAMAEIQFASGARSVLPVHEMAQPYTSWVQAKRAIQDLPMKSLLTKVVSAHVMGGCGLAGSENQGVTRPDGVHWKIDNLSIHDGSIFPTSIGANPQLSIYGITSRMAQGLAKRLSGQDVILA